MSHLFQPTYALPLLAGLAGGALLFTVAGADEPAAAPGLPSPDIVPLAKPEPNALPAAVVLRTATFALG